MMHTPLFLVVALALPASALAGDDPRISTSRGENGGAVVLYPRIIPASEDPEVLRIAAAIEAHTDALVRATRPKTPVDTRPAPERVCPQAGCKGVSVGSVLVHNGDTCAVAAWVAAPGRSPARPLAWSPGLTTKQASVPFREPVENALAIQDYQHCSTIVASLSARDEAVAEAIRAASGAAAPDQSP